MKEKEKEKYREWFLSCSGEQQRNQEYFYDVSL